MCHCTWENGGFLFYKEFRLNSIKSDKSTEATGKKNAGKLTNSPTCTEDRVLWLCSSRIWNDLSTTLDF